MLGPDAFAAAVSLLFLLPLITLMVSRAERDAATWLMLYIALLFVVPAKLVLGPAGAIGTPAIGVALIIAWLYCAGRVQRVEDIDADWQPVRLVVLLYAWYVVLTVAIAFSRELTPLEISASTREVIRLAAHVGVALTVADAVRSRERLDRVLRTLVYAASFIALLGVVDFFVGVNLAEYIRVPGLVNRGDLTDLSRSAFNRPSATTLHPIEFSVVLAVVLPIAIHYVFYSSPGGSRRIAIGCALLIALGVPMSVSRSGVVGLIVGLPVLSLAWSWRRKWIMGLCSTAFLVATWVTVPGLLGTIRGLFVNAEHDPSVQARTERLPKVIELFSQQPVFGRGFGTFSVDDYFLIDNEYYVTAIETGALGIVALLALMVVSVSAARAVRHFGESDSDRHLGQAVAAALVVVLFTTFTFDAFFYHIFTGVMFVLIGSAGALWRLAATERGPSSRQRHVQSNVDRSPPAFGRNGAYGERVGTLHR